MCRNFAFLLVLGLGLVALTSTAALATNYDIRIAGGNDDVEEYTDDHHMYLDSSDLEIPYEGSVGAGNEQVIGLRWIVPVPKGAKILKAYVEIEADTTVGGTESANVIVQGQLSPNAAPFTAATANVTGRPTTTAAGQVVYCQLHGGGPEGAIPGHRGDHSGDHRSARLGGRQCPGPEHQGR